MFQCKFQKCYEPFIAALIRAAFQTTDKICALLTSEFTPCNSGINRLLKVRSNIVRGILCDSEFNQFLMCWVVVCFVFFVEYLCLKFSQKGRSLQEMSYRKCAVVMYCTTETTST